MIDVRVDGERVREGTTYAIDRHRSVGLRPAKDGSAAFGFATRTVGLRALLAAGHSYAHLVAVGMSHVLGRDTP